jgi:hypothetical protein
VPGHLTREQHQPGANGSSFLPKSAPAAARGLVAHPSLVAQPDPRRDTAAAPAVEVMLNLTDLRPDFLATFPASRKLKKSLQLGMQPDQALFDLFKQA